MRPRLLAGFFVLTFSLAITACGSGVDDGGGSATTNSKTSGTATATRTPQIQAR
jgi:hypothetical protein